MYHDQRHFRCSLGTEKGFAKKQKADSLQRKLPNSHRFGSKQTGGFLLDKNLNASLKIGSLITFSPDQKITF